ncbi:MAG: zeta toxin family protein [Chthoniobacterales bacterium]|nr:zeta toxin family protein [Chthoniobacterales bacterium]
MSSPDQEQPICFIIAGPNGAGKTTFAWDFLLKELDIVHFVNADLIAAGLSPFDSSLVELKAGRLFLEELKRLARAKVNFAFETTLSGHSYLPLLKRWKSEGYRIEIIYLRLRSASLALERVAERVKQGGHNIPQATVLRRFERGWGNFLNLYRPLADDWYVYENSEATPQLIEKK